MEGLKERLKEFGSFLILRKGLLESTKDNYLKMASKMMRDIGSLNPTHSQLETIIMGLYERKMSFSYISNSIRVIEQLADFQENPIKLRRPRKQRQVLQGALTEAEVILVMSACKNIRERAMLTIMADSGVRCDELCNAKVKDLDLGGLSIKVHGKAKRDRVSFFSGECARVIQSYLTEFPRNPEDYLFTTLRNKNQMSGWDFRKIVRKIASRSPVKKRVHPHLFRHSLATNMLDRGANPVTIQEQLGHAHLGTTMLYVHSRKERVQAEYHLYRPKYF